MCLLLHMQESRFKLCFNTSGLKLPSQIVLVVWEWEWEEDDGSDMSNKDPDSQEQCNPYLPRGSNSESISTLPAQTHTVTYKCIGSVHAWLHGTRNTCSKTSKILREGESV